MLVFLRRFNVIILNVDYIRLKLFYFRINLIGSLDFRSQFYAAIIIIIFFKYLQ